MTVDAVVDQNLGDLDADVGFPLGGSGSDMVGEDLTSLVD